MADKILFPSWRFRAAETGHDARLVRSQAESDALGPGWANHPDLAVTLASLLDEPATSAPPAEAEPQEPVAPPVKNKGGRPKKSETP